MKTFPIALAAVSLCVGQLQAEPTEPDLKTELVALEKQSWEAWKNHNGKFFQNFLSEDHVEVGFNGVTNKQSVVTGVSSGICVVRSCSLDHFDLKLLAKDLALLTYRETQDTECGGKTVPAPCWVSSWYALRERRWQNLAYQQSQITK